MQQCKSAIIIRASCLSNPQVITEHQTGIPCYRATSHQRSILHLIVYKCWCYFLHSSHSLPPRLCPQVCSLHLYLHSFPIDRFIDTIFLDSICVNVVYLFFSFWLTSLCITGSKFIHLTRKYKFSILTIPKYGTIHNGYVYLYPHLVGGILFLTFSIC